MKNLENLANLWGGIFLGVSILYVAGRVVYHDIKYKIIEERRGKTWRLFETCRSLRESCIGREETNYQD